MSCLKKGNRRRWNHASTTTPITEEELAPVDVRTVIKSVKEWAEQPPTEHSKHRDDGDRDPVKPTYLEHGKRMVPRRSKRTMTEEEEGDQKEETEQSRSVLRKKKTITTADVSMSDSQPMVDLENSVLFEEDLIHAQLQQELPRPGNLDEEQLLYTKACSMLKVLPSRRFEQCLKSKRVMLGHQCLGPLGIRAVVVSLLNSLNVTELYVPENSLGSKGMRSLTHLIHNSAIQVLDVSDNQLGRKGASILSTAIKDSISLKHIKAAGNNFDDHTGRFFQDMISTNCIIRIIDLSRNRFCEQGAIQIARGMWKNEVVTHLDLNYNYVRRHGIQAMGKMLGKNSMLKQLDLSWNGIDIEGARDLGKGLNNNSSLTMLNLSGCRLTGKSLLRMQENMKANRTLKSLQIQNNPLTNADLTIFLKGLEHLPGSALTYVDASTVKVSQEVVDIVQRISQTKPGFTIIHMGLLFIRDLSTSFLQSRSFTEANPLEVLFKYCRQHLMRQRDIFSKFDRDHNGYLTQEELVQGFEDLGVPLIIAQLERLMVRLDKDGDNKVHFKELQEEYRVFLRRERRHQSRLPRGLLQN